MPVLHGWESFYAIIGPSAGALIGLQFILLTLIAMAPTSSNQAAAGEAFGTPTVVHFGVALLLSGIASAPLESATTVAVLWGLVGIGGLLYSIVVAWRMRSQTAYKPILEDWVFHFLLPKVGYVAVAAGAWIVRSDVKTGAFVVAGATLLLLFVGVRNAWDSITYHVFVGRNRPAGP
jgi:hypothetical protein